MIQVLESKGGEEEKRGEIPPRRGPPTFKRSVVGQCTAQEGKARGCERVRKQVGKIEKHIAYTTDPQANQIRTMLKKKKKEKTSKSRAKSSPVKTASAKDLNGHCSGSTCPAAQGACEKLPTPSITGAKQIETTMGSHYTPTTVATIKKECELPVWTRMWSHQNSRTPLVGTLITHGQYLRQLNTYLGYDPAIPLASIHPRDGRADDCQRT